ncbi:hypothetical protein EVAR_41513_1 [Eumeta japonica]|uniref:Uncharacterized protein n=1 Tax=Eumeta variegata TaxID=151549 RepID=A0A4C1X674_EUMVA|nr:hypothetical protein EVAR_41513_1 [Eumeta japonica]
MYNHKLKYHGRTTVFLKQCRVGLLLSPLPEHIFPKFFLFKFKTLDITLSMLAQPELDATKDLVTNVIKISRTDDSIPSPAHTWPISVDYCPQVRTKDTPSLAFVDVSAYGRAKANKLARIEGALGHAASGGSYWPLK